MSRSRRPESYPFVGCQRAHRPSLADREFAARHPAGRRRAVRGKGLRAGRPDSRRFAAPARADRARAAQLGSVRRRDRDRRDPPRRPRRADRRARLADLRRARRRSSALAGALHARGCRARRRASGCSCRNHRGFLDAAFATAKLGARTAATEHRLRRPAAARRRATARA